MGDMTYRFINGSWRSRLVFISIMTPFLGLAFILSQFLRSSPAVIAPNLRSELGLSVTELSSMPAALFLGSALMQLPVGILLDRFGPRKTITGFLLITFIGILGVSYSYSAIGLILTLFITGCGIAPVYMGLIVILSRWVPRDRLAAASSIAVAISGVGLLLSATPFAWASSLIGWRETLKLIGFGVAILSCVIWLVVRDRPPGSTLPDKKPTSLRETARGLIKVLSDTRLYGLAAVASVSVGSFLSTRALWTGPYLNDVFGLDLIDRGNVIFVLSTAWLFSALIYGPLDRLFDTRRGVVTVGAIIMALSFVLLSVNRSESIIVVTGLFVLLGLSASFSGLIFAHARALFPDTYTGRAVTAINLFIWTGVFFVQVITGEIVSFFPTDELGRSPQIAYQTMFSVLAISLFIAVLIYRRTEDIPPSKDIDI